MYLLISKTQFHQKLLQAPLLISADVNHYAMLRRRKRKAPQLSV